MKTFDESVALSLLDSENEFPVDFDRAWQWIGYGKKVDAKQFLIKNFEQGIDYVMLQPELGTLDTPRPKDKISLTVEAFKTWGMMANTEQGKQVRKYFLQCEKVAKQKAAELLATDRAMYDQLAAKTKALPLPEMSMRSRIIEAVDNYVFLFGLKHPQVWIAIYRKLKHTYHYDVAAKLKASGIKGRSKLEQIEADNKLEELRAVAQLVLKTEI